MPKTKRKIDRERVFSMINEHWPIHVTEVAYKMGFLSDDSTPEETKAVLAHLKYHFDQLARAERIRVKKIGMALVAWPREVETVRLLSEKK